MSRSYRKQPFWSICGWCSTDKVVAGRMVRTAHKRAVQLEWKNGDFEDFILPHRQECRFNDTWSWSSDGRKHYHSLSQHDWEEHLRWRDVPEEEIKIMEMEDYLDGKVPDTRPSYISTIEDYYYGRPYSRRRQWFNNKDWPPQWWREMFRK